MFVKPESHLSGAFNQNFKKIGAGASLNGVIKHVLHKNPKLPEYKRRLTYQTIHKLNNDPTAVFNTKQTREIIEGMGDILQYKYKKNGALHTLRHFQRVFKKEQAKKEKKANLSPAERAKEEEKEKNRNLVRNREGREEEENKGFNGKNKPIRSLGLNQWQEASVSANQVIKKSEQAKKEPEPEKPLLDMMID